MTRLRSKPITLASTLLAAIGAILLGGCSNMADDEQSSFQLQMSLDRNQFQLGEAVGARIVLTNISGDTQDMRALNYDSVEFWFKPNNSQAEFRRFPVYSKYEPEVKMEQLQSGGSRSRAFVLTLVTEKPGLHTLCASYSPSPMLPPPPGASKAEIEKLNRTKPKAWSNHVQFSVSSVRAFNRDAKGVLLREDAVHLCLAKSRVVPREFQARLVWDEMGFLLWWIRADLEGGSSQAWFVDPYLGRVKSQPAPLELKIVEEKKSSKTPTALNIRRNVGEASYAPAALPPSPSAPGPAVPEAIPAAEAPMPESTVPAAEAPVTDWPYGAPVP